MKRYIYHIIITLSLLFPSYAFSQFSFGIKGQINNMSTPLVIKSDLLSKPLGATLNPGFGLFFEFTITDEWAFQPEINYQEHRKSFLLSGSERIINISIIEYIRVPLLFKYRFPFDEWNLTGLIGPNPGYGVALKSGETNQNLRITQYEKLNFKAHQVKQFDFGLIAGIGIEKTIANKFKTSLSLRYQLGLVDIMKDDLSTFYNRGYVLDMGFAIPFRHLRKGDKATDKQ